MKRREKNSRSFPESSRGGLGTPVEMRWDERGRRRLQERTHTFSMMIIERQEEVGKAKGQKEARTQRERKAETDSDPPGDQPCKQSPSALLCSAQLSHTTPSKQEEEAKPSHRPLQQQHEGVGHALEGWIWVLFREGEEAGRQAERRWRFGSM